MLKDRKGFVRIAVEEGIDGGIVPVYHFGNTKIFDFVPQVRALLRAPVQGPRGPAATSAASLPPLTRLPPAQCLAHVHLVWPPPPNSPLPCSPPPPRPPAAPPPPPPAPQSLQKTSRRLRSALGFLVGRWGLPVPRQVDLYMVSGPPIPVTKMARDHPDFDVSGGARGRVIWPGFGGSTLAGFGSLARPRPRACAISLCPTRFPVVFG